MHPSENWSVLNWLLVFFRSIVSNEISSTVGSFARPGGGIWADCKSKTASYRSSLSLSPNKATTRAMKFLLNSRHYCTYVLISTLIGRVCGECIEWDPNCMLLYRPEPPIEQKQSCHALLSKQVQRSWRGRRNIWRFLHWSNISQLWSSNLNPDGKFLCKCRMQSNCMDLKLFPSCNQCKLTRSSFCITRVDIDNTHDSCFNAKRTGRNH